MTGPVSKSGLADMLEAALSATQDPVNTGAVDIARTSLRIPRTVLDEVGKVAMANGMSVSLVINLLLDNYLRDQAGKGYSELASWYPDYALRKMKNDR